MSVFDEGQTEEKRRKMSLDLTNQEWKEGEKLVGSVSVLDDVNRRYKKSRGPKAKMEVKNKTKMKKYEIENKLGTKNNN